MLADDRRAAAAELRDLVVESRAAQLAVGAIGLPALTSVLRDERDDVELAHGGGLYSCRTQLCTAV